MFAGAKMPIVVSGGLVTGDPSATAQEYTLTVDLALNENRRIVATIGWNNPDVQQKSFPEERERPVRNNV